MKKISILGASGSIGSQTLKVLKNHQDKFSLVSFSVYNNVSVIDEILSTFKDVYLVSVKDLNKVKDLIDKYPNVSFVENDLNKVACSNCDIVVNALVGFVGLIPTINAIKANKDVALANKESLVVAGEIIMDLAKKHNVNIIPVDSEHSAIFQCLEDNEINKIILTASGGPFYNKSSEEIKNVTLNEALNHPTWVMGKKITIDSATMFNKAFEIIEASHLFSLKKEQIEVIIHPQSIVHSLVEYKDGSMKAHLAVSDMKIAIAYALSHPKRLNNVASSLKLQEVGNLQFFKVNEELNKPIQLAYKALQEKGTFPTVLNAANEEAVNLFLNEKIKFHEIYEIVNKTLNAHKNDKSELTIEKIIEADSWARKYIRGIIK